MFSIGRFLNYLKRDARPRPQYYSPQYRDLLLSVTPFPFILSLSLSNFFIIYFYFSFFYSLFVVCTHPHGLVRPINSFLSLRFADLFFNLSSLPSSHSLVFSSSQFFFSLFCITVQYLST